MTKQWNSQMYASMFVLWWIITSYILICFSADMMIQKQYYLACTFLILERWRGEVQHCPCGNGSLVWVQEKSLYTNLNLPGVSPFQG